MSALEFLQTFPSQKRVLLSSLEVVDPNASTVVRFETHEVQPYFPYHVYFQVHVECLNKTIKLTVIDEGAFPYVCFLLEGP